MVDKLGIYNAAMRFLSATRLSSLTEDRKDRRELDAVYDHAIDSMLEKGIWKFALRTVLMTPDTDIDSAFGPTHAYPKPDDFKRLRGFSSDEFFVHEIEDYREENGIWYTDHHEVYLSYVSNGNDYGRNLGLWPNLFVEAVGGFMAELTCISINKDRGDRKDIINLSARALRDAKVKEALDERVKPKPPGRLVTSRLGIGRGMRARGIPG